MKKRRLPTGIQTFRELREAGCYYVDKTAHVLRLVEGGKHYFLSRPRRFGKSLLLDTVKELFEGNEALFRGLHVHRHWDWTVRRPVLRLDFSGAGGGREALRANLMQQLDDIEEDAGLAVTRRYEDAAARCRQILRALRRESGRRVVVLGYPNREVRQGLNRRLLRAMAPDAAGQVASRVRLRELLAANDLAGVEALFRAFFAAIPYNWHVNTPIAGYEGCYASVFYAHFAAAGLDVATEDASSRGRLDMAVRAAGRVYLFEFKVVDRKPEGQAVAQLRERRYADKYRHLGEPIHLVGVEFSRETRNVAAFTVEPG